jgi:hypothetical protein
MLFVCILLILLIKINISISLKKDGIREEGVVEIWIIKTIKLKLDIPLFKMRMEEMVPYIEILAQLGSKRTDFIEKDAKLDITKHKVKKLHKKLLRLKRLITPWTPHCKNVISNSSLKYFHWETVFSTGDAFYTSLSSSFLWILKTQVICRLFREKAPLGEHFLIDVKPSFSNACFSTTFKCIISIKLRDIITASFLGLVDFIKGGKLWLIIPLKD